MAFDAPGRRRRSPTGGAGDARPSRPDGSPSPPTTPTAVLAAITGGAVARGRRARRADRSPPIAGGRVPQLAEHRASDVDRERRLVAGHRRRWCSPDPLPVADVLRTPIALFFTILLPTRHAGAVQRPVRRRQVETDGRRGRSASSTRAGWRRSRRSAPPTPTSPTWCRSGARRACSSAGADARAARRVHRRLRRLGASCSPSSAPGCMLAVGVLFYDLADRGRPSCRRWSSPSSSASARSRRSAWPSPALVPTPTRRSGRKRHDPAARVRLERLHPARGRAAVARDARRRVPAEAVRRRVPGHAQPARRRAGVRLGQAGADRGCGAWPARSWPVEAFSGSRRPVARRVDAARPAVGRHDARARSSRARSRRSPPLRRR